MTNGLTHPYYLGEFIFILGGIRLICFLHFYFNFDENHVSKQKSPISDVAFCYTVFLCPKNRMPSLYGLRLFAFSFVSESSLYTLIVVKTHFIWYVYIETIKKFSDV